MASAGKANDSESISEIMDEPIDQKMADISLKTSFISIDDFDTTSNEVFLKQVRDILNKMTPNTFDTLLKDIKGMNITAVEQLNGIVSLIFEKAIFEQTFPHIYARLYSKLSESIGSEFIKFKKAVILKCQHEFQHVVAVDTIVAEKLRPFLQNIEEATDPDEKAKSQTNYENEQWKLKRRSIGIVRFVGELFKSGILTKRIMMNCIQGLLERNSEYKLECLCELLTVIGSRFEDKKTSGNDRDLGTYFQMLKEIVDNTHQSVKISNRVRFLIQDVIDLRKNNWIPRIQMKTEQIETKLLSRRAQRNHIKKENYYQSSGSTRGNRGGDSNHNQSSGSTRGNRGGDSNHNQSSGSKRGDRGGGSYQINNRDCLPQRFKFKKANDPLTLRTVSPFWSDDSNAPPAYVDGFSTFEASDSGSIDNNNFTESRKNRRGDTNNCRNDSKYDSARPSRSSKQFDQPQKPTVESDIGQESKMNLWAMVLELYNSAIVAHQESTNRIFAGQIVCTWINRKLITVNDNFRALKEFLASVFDSDDPMIWVHVAEFITPAMKQNYLSLKQLRGVCNDECVMEQILQHLIPHLMMEHGPQFVRSLFKGCEWLDLISAEKVNKFIHKHKFEFVKDNKMIVRRTASGPTNIQRIQTRVKEFLNDGADTCVIQEFITVNPAESNTEFIKELTAVVMESLINDKTLKFNEQKYVAGLALLTTYIDDNIDFQLQCLNAIQMFINELQYPKDVIQMIFSRLYDDQVVFKDVFYKWRDSTEILEGKSEALSNLQKFFELIDKEDNLEEKI